MLHFSTFDSPIVDATEVARDADRIWKSTPQEPAGVEMRLSSQSALLRRLQPIAGEFDYPETPEDCERPYDFYLQNDAFEGLDARIWYCLARHFKPRRIVEVGGGFSSLLVADINRRYFKNNIAFFSIEPHPNPTLQSGVPGLSKLLPFRVQDIPMQLFNSLQRDDVLFIDSSHIAKTGSDVTFLCLEVLPRLSPGVLIHFHDIFIPDDYPRQWVIHESCNWNEQYLVQALLVHTSGFEVIFASLYASRHLTSRIVDTFGHPYTGGSLWIRRTESR